MRLQQCMNTENGQSYFRDCQDEATGQTGVYRRLFVSHYSRNFFERVSRGQRVSKRAARMEGAILL